MISISAAVEDIIKDTPLLEDGLFRGIINYSALARELQPQIEKKLLKPAQRGAIVMALKRISVQLKKRQKIVKQAYYVSDLTVRSKLTEFTFTISPTIIEKEKELFTLASQRTDIFYNASQGIREITLVISDGLEQVLEKIFISENLISKITNLSSITIRFHKNIVNVPGLYYSILKLITWEGISVVEVLSTSMELTIIFQTKDIDIAFSILKNKF